MPQIADALTYFVVFLFSTTLHVIFDPMFAAAASLIYPGVSYG